MSSIRKHVKQDMANRALAVAMVGLRSSNAAGKHADRRSKRARTRGAAKARALREQA